VYHYAGNNPVKYTDPDGRAAWGATSEWTDDAIEGYKQFVNEKIAQYESNEQSFTCEDLALNLLIDYASQNGLPVSIENGKGVFSSNSNKYKNVEQFRNAVLSSTGANDLLNFSNTVISNNLSSGDLLLLDTGLPGGTHDDKVSHVQVVTDFIAPSGVISIAQGSTRKRGSANPSSSKYIGVPITRGNYHLLNDTYSRINGAPVQNAINSFGILRYARWNFKGMR
jgi:hypothetical protein